MFDGNETYNALNVEKITKNVAPSGATFFVIFLGSTH